MVAPPRYAFALFTLVCACADDDSGSATGYCEKNARCPSGLACDAATLMCVEPAAANAYQCPFNDREPNDSLSQAVVLPMRACEASPLAYEGCLAAADEDWFVMPTAACSTASTRATLSFPIAWEPISVELTDNSGTAVATQSIACPEGIVAPGKRGICFEATLVSSATYAFHLQLVGQDDCAGKCAQNDYHLQVALTGAP